MSTPTKFKVNEDLLKSIQAVGDAVIDVEELTKSLQTERNSTSRHIHRNFISGKENKRTGAALTEFKATRYLIECGFGIIHDDFDIYEDIKFNITYSYNADDAIFIYNAYNDRERFLKIMKQLAEIFTIDRYFILENNDDIFNVNCKNNTIIKAEGVEIDDYNAKFVSWCGIEDFVHVSICYPEIKKLVEKNYRPYIK